VLGSQILEALTSASWHLTGQGMGVLEAWHVNYVMVVKWIGAAMVFIFFRFNLLSACLLWWQMLYTSRMSWELLFLYHTKLSCKNIGLIFGESECLRSIHKKCTWHVKIKNLVEDRAEIWVWTSFIIKIKTQQWQLFIFCYDSLFINF